MNMKTRPITLFYSRGRRFALVPTRVCVAIAVRTTSTEHRPESRTLIPNPDARQRSVGAVKTCGRTKQVHINLAKYFARLNAGPCKMSHADGIKRKTSTLHKKALRMRREALLLDHPPRRRLLKGRKGWFGFVARRRPYPPRAYWPYP
jgi:hypothetical protein